MNHNLNARLYMVEFQDIDSFEDDGFCEYYALFVAAKNERGARLITVANDPTHYGVLDETYPMTLTDLGATDKPLGFCTEEWDVIPDAAWPIVEAAQGWNATP